MPTDRESGRPKGFGYVQFGDQATATKAFEGAQGKELEGRNLRLDYSTPKDSSGGGGRGGGYSTSTLDDADNLVANAAPAVVDLLFEDVDTLDEECSRVVYDLCITGGSDEYMLMLRIASTHIESSFESDHGK